MVNQPLARQRSVTRAHCVEDFLMLAQPQHGIGLTNRFNVQRPKDDPENLKKLDQGLIMEHPVEDAMEFFVELHVRVTDPQSTRPFGQNRDSAVTRVFANLTTRLHDQAADDVGLVQLTYANGAAGTVVSVGYREGAPKHLTELTCTRGMLNIGYDAIQIGREGHWQEVPVEQHADWMHVALVTEWRAFAAAARSETAPAVSGAYARHIMEVAFAAEESAQSGRAIVVPED
jgi:hypothetical protein